jgi:hypothetical protein
LTEVPKYPHVADFINCDQFERVERVLQKLEERLSKNIGMTDKERRREAKFHQKPNLVLIVNNLAGLKNANLDWYQRILGLIQQQSEKFGINIIVTSLPRSSGAKLSSSDMKIINSRIVFPSINKENYWRYLDRPESKLPKLTRMEEGIGKNGCVSRAHWLCTTEHRYQEPIELQIAQPELSGMLDEEIAGLMRSVEGIKFPNKIKTLQQKYKISEAVSGIESKLLIPIGIDQKTLKPLNVDPSKLPSIWGISGALETGKSNFLTVLSSQLHQKKDAFSVDVISVYSSSLTDFCEGQKINVHTSAEEVIKFLKGVAQNDVSSPESKKRIILVDDLHLLWEREEEEVIRLLDELPFCIDSENLNLMVVASFTYPGVIRSNRNRNTLLKRIHDNKTGIIFGYEDSWALSPSALSKYQRRMWRPEMTPGRGLFILRGEETAIQTYCISN